MIVHPSERATLSKPFRSALIRVVVRRLVAAINIEATGTRGRRIAEPRYRDIALAALRLDSPVKRAGLAAAGRRIVDYVVAPRFQKAARKCIRSDRVSGFIGALVTPLALRWLVGEVTAYPQRARATIRRCRFLVATESPTLCVGLCKAASEHVLTRQLNIPIKMYPQVATGRCELCFGAAARRDTTTPRSTSL